MVCGAAGVFITAGLQTSRPHYSAQTEPGAHGACALRHVTAARRARRTVSERGGREGKVFAATQVNYQTTSTGLNGVSTLLSSSWSTFTPALSSPAEASAEADGSSRLFPSRCTELSAPMVMSHSGELSFSLWLRSLCNNLHSKRTAQHGHTIHTVQMMSSGVQLRAGLAWFWSAEL